MEDRLWAERIVDQLADAVIYANRSGAIVRWNRASTGLFGFVPEEALGLDLIIPAHLRPAHWSGFNAATTKGVVKLQGRPMLTRALHKNRRKLYVEKTFAVVKGDEREVLGSVALARDVTDRVEREPFGSPHDLRRTVAMLRVASGMVADTLGILTPCPPSRLPVAPLTLKQA